MIWQMFMRYLYFIWGWAWSYVKWLLIWRIWNRTNKGAPIVSCGSYFVGIDGFIFTRAWFHINNSPWKNTVTESVMGIYVPTHCLANRLELGILYALLNSISQIYIGKWLASLIFLLDFLKYFRNVLLLFLLIPVSPKQIWWHLPLYFLLCLIALLNVIEIVFPSLIQNDLLISRNLMLKPLLFRLECGLVVKLWWIQGGSPYFLGDRHIILAHPRVGCFVVQIHNKGLDIVKRVVLNAIGDFYFLVTLHENLAWTPVFLLGRIVSRTWRLIVGLILLETICLGEFWSMGILQASLLHRCEVVLELRELVDVLLYLFSADVMSRLCVNLVL